MEIMKFMFKDVCFSLPKIILIWVNSGGVILLLLKQKDYFLIEK